MPEQAHRLTVTKSPCITGTTELPQYFDRKDQNITSVELVAKDGSKISMQVAELGNYFVAYNRTQSKSSTNIPEGKRHNLLS